MKTHMLRTCKADMTSYGGFKWPESGPVSCPDWDSKPVCGGGLHGLLRGCGDAQYLDWSPDAKWLVVEVDDQDIVAIGGDKIKARRGTTVVCGDRKAATDYLISLYPNLPIVGGTATAGYRGTATAGDAGTATAGHRGTATAGDAGTATAGYAGTATAGDAGSATAGYAGTATAGYAGTIILKHWDGMRKRLIVGYVGENGIEANVPYVVKNGVLVKKQDAQ